MPVKLQRHQIVGILLRREDTHTNRQTNRLDTVKVDGQRLRALRRKKQLTQRSLADLAMRFSPEIHIVAGYLSDIEAGRRQQVGRAIAVALATALATDLTYLSSTGTPSGQDAAESSSAAKAPGVQLRAIAQVVNQAIEASGQLTAQLRQAGLSLERLTALGPFPGLQSVPDPLVSAQETLSSIDPRPLSLPSSLGVRYDGKSLNDVIRLYDNRAKRRLDEGDARLAASDYRDAIDLAESSEEVDVDLVDLYLDSFEPLYIAFDIENCLSNVQKAIRLIESGYVGSSGNKSVRLSRAYRCLSRIYDNIGEYDKARVHAEKAISLDPQNWLAKQALAIVFVNLGRFADAEAILNGVLKDTPGDRHSLPRVTILNAIVRVYIKQERTADAMMACNRGILIYSEMGEEKSIRSLAYAYYYLMQVHVLLGRHVAAIGYMARAQQLFARLGDQRNSMQLNYHLAHILLRLDAENSLAAETWTLANDYVRYYESLHKSMPSYIAKGKRLQAKIRGLQSRYEEAEGLFRQSIATFEDIKNPFELGLTLYEYGTMLVRQQQFGRANEVLTNARSKFNDLGVRTKVEEIEKVMVSLLQKDPVSS